jgi:hypothetical protein
MWHEEEVKNYHRLMELAERLKAKKKTREEALQALVRAGILDESGHYTEPYKILEQYSASK